MTVYILSTGSHSDWTILGVYSTILKAEDAKTWFERPKRVDWQGEPYCQRANPIAEIELDRPETYLGNISDDNDPNGW